jgi:hypothetical protein
MTKRTQPGKRSKDPDGIQGRGQPRKMKAAPEEKEKRSVRVNYGMSRCLYCRKTFERQRPWSKYDTPYCRMQHWHMLNRRKTAPGMIVEVDGELLDRPIPAYDAKFEEKIEREVAELSKRPVR